MLPVILAAIVHTVFIKRDLLPALKAPIAEKWFGANKTWRGLVVVPMLTALFVYLVIPLETLWQGTLLISFDRPIWIAAGETAGAPTVATPPAGAPEGTPKAATPPVGEHK